jgi:hypothetical protein
MKTDQKRIGRRGRRKRPSSLALPRLEVDEGGQSGFISEEA